MRYYRVICHFRIKTPAIEQLKRRYEEEWERERRIAESSYSCEELNTSDRSSPIK